MTNAELAASLNSELALTGRQAVTADIIRQWVDWGVLPRAQALAKGRGRAIEWLRDDASLKRARRLAVLRDYNVVRETAVIAQIWLECGGLEFERIRAAILAEHRRAQAAIIRGVSSDTRHDAKTPLSQVRKKALLRQAGSLDARLKGTSFELPSQTVLRVFDAVATAESSIDAVSNVISRQIQFISPNPSQLFIENSDIIEISRCMASGISGMFGSRDEIERSGEHSISSAPESHFRLARRVWRKGYLSAPQNYRALSDFFPDWPIGHEFESISRQIGATVLVGPWAVSSFAGVLHMIENTQKIS